MPFAMLEGKRTVSGAAAAKGKALPASRTRLTAMFRGPGSGTVVK